MAAVVVLAVVGVSLDYQHLFSWGHCQGVSSSSFVFCFYYTSTFLYV